MVAIVIAVALFGLLFARRITRCLGAFSRFGIGRLTLQKKVGIQTVHATSKRIMRLAYELVSAQLIATHRGAHLGGGFLERLQFASKVDVGVVHHNVEQRNRSACVGSGLLSIRNDSHDGSGNGT